MFYKKPIITILLILISNNCLSFNFVNNKNKICLRPEFFKELCETFHPDFFIETGTNSGATTLVAAEFFKHVYTVELALPLYENAKKLLSNKPNISIFYDNSPNFLKKIIPQCNGLLVFWLDAHACGEGTAMSNDDSNDPEAITPIRKELEVIAESALKDCIIIIDDMRGFGSTINNVEYLASWPYPTIQEIQNICSKLNPDFNYVLIGDQLLIYDQTKYNPIFSRTVQACTQTRFYNGSNLTDKQLLSYENDIMNALPEEKKFIANLYEWTTSWEEPFFLHDLWYGLICMGSENWKDAYIAINKVPNRIQTYSKYHQLINKPISYTHWRIEEYLKNIKTYL